MVSQRSWNKATNQRPCPACDSPDWCMHDEHSGLCNRDRVPDGCHDGGQQKGGGRLWFRDAPASPSSKSSKANARPTPLPVATSGELDRVYRRLAVLLPLPDAKAKTVADERSLTLDRLADLAFAYLPAWGKQRSEVIETLDREFGRELLLKIPGLVAKGDKLDFALSGGGLIIPHRDLTGNILAMQIRLDSVPEGKPRYQWLSGAGGPSIAATCYLAGEPAASGRVILTEGAFKAIAGADRFQALAIGLPGASMIGLALPMLKDVGAKEILLAYDADHSERKDGKPNQVFGWLRSAVKNLRAEGYTAALLRWHRGSFVQGETSKGIDNAIQAGDDLEELHGDQVDQHLREVAELLGMAEEVQENLEEPLEEAEEFEEDNRPTVRIRKNDLQAQKRALAAQLSLLDPPMFFEREGSVVAVDDHRLTRPSVGALRSDLDEQFRFVVRKMRDDKEVFQVIIPPPTLLETLFCRPAHFGTPKLRYFATSPVILRDGTVTNTPGYYADHLAYYSGEVACGDVADSPTRDNVTNARALIFEPLQDFPFVEQDRTNLIALLLALVGRGVIDGLVPPFMISANTPGTGKGLLSEVASRMASGKQASTSTWKSDSEEMRKSITSSLLAGERLVIFDNVNETMDSGIFAAATTSRTWTDRAMGGNSILKLENRTVFLATANNPTMSGEVSRRFVTIELATNYENPYERRGFAIPDLLQWIEARQGDILAALLTLWRAWFSAGKPRWYERKLGSYEDFCEIVGGVLAVAGIEGFLANRERVREEVDIETATWRDFVCEWWRVYQENPVSTSQLHALCLFENPDEEFAYRRDPRPGRLLDHILGSGREESQRTKLGLSLAKVKNRTFGLYQIQRASEKSRGLARYCLASSASQEKELYFSPERQGPPRPNVPPKKRECLNQADKVGGTLGGTLEQRPPGEVDRGGRGGPSRDVPHNGSPQKNAATKPLALPLGDVGDGGGRCRSLEG